MTGLPLAALAEAVERFFAGPGAPWADAAGVVGFSGGADSTALAILLAGRARRRGLALTAVHLDHGLDPASADRAAAAADAARRLGLPFVAERRPPAPGEHRAAGVEAAARRRRYRFLIEMARRHGATWVATAHHRDDQAETVLLRLLFGSGVEGLGGVRPLARPASDVTLLRPFLAVGRGDIETALAAAGIGWTDDPTNRDPSIPRNRVRHHLLAVLARREGMPAEQLTDRLARVAAAAGPARDAVAGRLARRLDLDTAASPGSEPDAPSVDLAALAALPAELLASALALLHRGAGIDDPPPAAARRELARQLAVGAPGAPGASARRRPMSIDAGRGWRWGAEGGRLALRRGEPPAASRSYSCTLRLPGEVELPELGVRVRVEQRPRADWMFQGDHRRVGLALPLSSGDTVVVRNRRPGDRLRPLGAPGSRRLKDLLIDHRVPRDHRDRLPLLCLGARGAEIAWVPGVTIGHRYRLPEAGGAATVWVAEIVPADGIGSREQPLVETR